MYMYDIKDVNNYALRLTLTFSEKAFYYFNDIGTYNVWRSISYIPNMFAPPPPPTLGESGSQ